MFRSVDPLLKPDSMAIVGASETGGDGWSRVLFHNLKDAGFPLKVYLINPNRDELWDQKVYPDFASLPELAATEPVIALSSRNSSRPHLPFSRPLPDCL